MQIVVKAKPQFADRAAALAEGVLRSVFGGVGVPIGIQPVFPNARHGDRARMFAATLPDEVGTERLTAARDALASSGHFEYAEMPAPRRPLQ
jgi:hypothetical protein